MGEYSHLKKAGTKELREHRYALFAY